jgi:hypothetical protein
MVLSKEIAYLQENSINHWGVANDYAEKKFPMVIGETTIEDYEELQAYKDSYEKGMLKVVELLMEKGLIKIK